jgi:arginine exporter protein ArgO
VSALPLDSFAAGAVAGIAVALPLGAIGVLIVQEGIRHGWRRAAAGATGVGLVDFGYCVVALAAGGVVTRTLDGHQRTVQLVGAAILVAVALRGLWTATRPPAQPRVAEPLVAEPVAAEPVAGPAGAPATSVAVAATRGGELRVLRRFVLLTAINPMTAVYFVVLAAALGETVRGWGAGAAFAAGVLLASWLWQLVLAAAGSVAGARLPPWARVVTSVLGYLVVLGYAARLALG